MNKLPNSLYYTGLILCAISITGCGNELPTLTGKVTLDGNPPPEDLGSGTISFTHVDGGSTAFANIQPDGSYEAKTGAAEGLKPGRYKVRVAAVIGAVPPPSPDNPSPRINFWHPQRYNTENSGLEVEVEPGSNVYDIELKSQ